VRKKTDPECLILESGIKLREFGELSEFRELKSLILDAGYW
jgi:hypothetical protein